MKRLLVVVATLLISSIISLANAPADAARPPRVPKAPSDACGPQLLKSDGTAWTCTFNDEFNGNSLDRTKWVPQTLGFSTGTAQAYACYLDDAGNVSVSGGALNLTVRKLARPVPCTSNPALAPSVYTSGMVSTYHLFSQQYGRFEARVKVAATRYPGLQESFWLWPDDRVGSSTSWPAAGEIDIVETYSAYPDLGIPFLHYTANDNGGPIPGTNTAWSCAVTRGVWNTYALEWTPTQLKISINDKVCLVNTSEDPAFQKPYIAAFTQALGGAGNAYDGRAPLPASMNIDYFRVWR